MPAPAFFGYFGNGYTNWGDSIDRTTLESNLNWLQNEPALVEQLRKTAVNGQKAVVNISLLCFKYPSINFQDNWQGQISEWWASLPADVTDVIVALAISDEPFRANDKHYHYPIVLVHQNLNEAARYVRGLTGKLTCMTASGPEYDSWGVPTDIDWIGMYRYSYNTHWTQLMFSFFNLLRQKQKSQKVVAIVDSYGDQNNLPSESRIKSFNEWWKSFISWSDDVVAVVPYLYQTTVMIDGNGKPLQVWGAQSMHQVRLELMGWGRKITGRSMST